MREDRPKTWDYMPPREWETYAGDPIDRLPGGDELAAELAEAIDARFAQLDRHVHSAKGGCPICAAEAAETVVRYIERNTRVLHSEALAPEEVNRARSTIRSIPYLSSGMRLRLGGKYAGDPGHPTVGDLLEDLDTIRDAILVRVAEDREREQELYRYRKWHDAVREISEIVVERLDPRDPATIEEQEG